MLELELNQDQAEDQHQATRAARTTAAKVFVQKENAPNFTKYFFAKLWHFSTAQWCARELAMFFRPFGQWVFMRRDIYAQLWIFISLIKKKLAKNMCVKPA